MYSKTDMVGKILSNVKELNKSLRTKDLGTYTREDLVNIKTKLDSRNKENTFKLKAYSNSNDCLDSDILDEFKAYITDYNFSILEVVENDLEGFRLFKLINLVDFIVYAEDLNINSLIELLGSLMYVEDLYTQIELEALRLKKLASFDVELMQKQLKKIPELFEPMFIDYAGHINATGKSSLLNLTKKHFSVGDLDSFGLFKAGEPLLEGVKTGKSLKELCSKHFGPDYLNLELLLNYDKKVEDEIINPDIETERIHKECHDLLISKETGKLKTVKEIMDDAYGKTNFLELTLGAICIEPKNDNIKNIAFKEGCYFDPLDSIKDGPGTSYKMSENVDHAIVLNVYKEHRTKPKMYHFMESDLIKSPDCCLGVVSSKDADKKHYFDDNANNLKLNVKIEDKPPMLHVHSKSIKDAYAELKRLVEHEDDTTIALNDLKKDLEIELKEAKKEISTIVSRLENITKDVAGKDKANKEIELLLNIELSPVYGIYGLDEEAVKKETERKDKITTDLKDIIKRNKKSIDLSVKKVADLKNEIIESTEKYTKVKRKIDKLNKISLQHCML